MGTLFTGQTPDEDVTDGSGSRSLGQRWQTSVAGQELTGGRYWVPSTGLASVALWQVWLVSDPSAPKAEVDLNTLPSPTSGAWMDVPYSGGYVPPANVNLIVCTFTDVAPGVDHYVFDNTGSPGSNGNINWDISIYKNDGTSTQMPDQTNFPGGMFFSDITLSDAPNEGSAALGVTLALAAAGQSDHDGTAALGMTLALAATGNTEHDGTAGLGATLALAATGATDHDGTAAPAITLALAAAGERPSDGTAGLGLTLTLAATGSSASSGTVVRPNTGTITRPFTGIVTRPS